MTSPAAASPGSTNTAAPVASTAPVLTEDMRDHYRGTHALVIGATGFIGRWVSRLLTAAGAHVHAMVRDRASFQGIAGPWSIVADPIEVDLLDTTQVERVIRTVSPDIVFNLAGYGVDRSERDAELMQRLNADLVRHIGTAVAALAPRHGAGARLVHVGSALEYGRATGPVSEATPANPHTDYGRTKAAGTQAVRAIGEAAGLPLLTARAFTVFGPGEHEDRLLPTLRRAAMDDAPARLSAGAQQRDFAYVEDVASGLLRLGMSHVRPGEVVNLATGRMVSVREFAMHAARVLGVPPERLHFGTEPVRNEEQEISGVSTTRLEQLTQWLPDANLEATIARAVAPARA